MPEPEQCVVNGEPIAYVIKRGTLSYLDNAPYTDWSLPGSLTEVRISADGVTIEAVAQESVHLDRAEARMIAKLILDQVNE